MIYTITFNPALDYVITVDHFQQGLVNRVCEEHIFCGGKGINVSAILKELGYESEALGFVAGFTGDEIVRRAKSEYDIKTDFIKVEKGMSRINVKMRSDEETEINGMGPQITDEDVEKLFKKLDTLKEGDVLVLSGSIPKCISPTIYEEILERLQDKGILFVVDATGQLLVNVLAYHPFLIKPNNHEIEEIFNVKLKTEEDLVKYANKLQEMGARNVLISLAGDGSLLVDENGNTHRLGVCKGTVKNSVGAGDSMVAGFVAGYLNNGDYDEALALGTACGGATAFSYSLAKRDFIDECLAQLKETINCQMSFMKERYTAITSLDKARINSILDLEEEDMLAGYPELLNLAYEGKIDLNDYVYLLCNSNEAKEYDINIPTIDWDKVQLGVERKIDELLQSHEEPSHYKVVISEEARTDYIDSQWKVYETIENYRNGQLQLFENNRNLFIELMNKDPHKAYEEIRNKRLDCFSDKMAEVTLSAFKQSSNADKNDMILNTKEIIRTMMYSSEFKSEQTKTALNILKSGLESYLKQHCSSNKNSIAAAHANHFIRTIDILLAELKK